MPVIKLTQQFIDQQLQVPGDQQRIEYCDADLPGMYIEVRSTSPGQGTFYLRYKDPTRKTCHQKIGTTKEMTLAQARNRAKEVKAEIRLGADPRAEAKARKAVPTLTEFFEEQYTPYAQPRKRSFKSDVSLFNLRLKPKFGHLRLNEIHRREVQAFHGNLLNEGLAPATADHYMKLMRRLLNLAVEYNVIDNNKLDKAKLHNPDNRMEVFLEGESLERLISVLLTDSNQVACNVFMFLLASAARLNEALSATWDQIDLENRIWKIPAKISKSKKMRSVPLSEAALECLRKINHRQGNIFISRKTKMPLKNLHKAWQKIRIKAGMPHLRIHDMRHTAASLLINSGHTIYTVQHILGHQSVVTSSRYSHLNSKTLFSAADSASKAILSAIAATERKAAKQTSQPVECVIEDETSNGLHLDQASKEPVSSGGLAAKREEVGAQAG
jgi:integrase